MKELTKIFNGTELSIKDIDGELYFNVSGISNKYNKRFSEWANQKQTKKYLSSVGIPTCINSSLIINEVVGEIFIHRKLLVKFARFISIDFEIWADELIYSILTGKVSLLNKQLQQKDKSIKEMSKRIYAKPNGSGLELVTRIQKDFGLDITPHDLNLLLVSKGLLQVEEVVVERLVNNNMRNNMPLLHVETVLKICRAEGITETGSFFNDRPTLF